jgi:hypothetical protein
VSLGHVAVAVADNAHDYDHDHDHGLDVIQSIGAPLARSTQPSKVAIVALSG